MVEDQGVASFPDMPKKEEHDIRACSIRGREVTAEGPVHAVLTRQGQVTNAEPNSACPGTANENMCIRFQFRGARFTF